MKMCEKLVDAADGVKMPLCIVEESFYVTMSSA